MTRPSRTLTTCAVGFLLLDAILLGYGGVVLRRSGLLLAAVVCAAAAVAVILLWRRYRRTLADLDIARADIRREVEAIRDLLNTRNTPS